MSLAPSPASTPIDDLRREIDRIDDQIHDLLMARTEIVERIGAAKEAGRYGLLRPAREALIMRRLLARHRGAMPTAIMIRVYRELISGLTRLQGPFQVTVYAPDERRLGFWDLARDYFGSSTPMTAVNSPQAALRAVADGTATVGVVPFPADDDADPWWRFLTPVDARSPHIAARLPFFSRGNSRGDDRDALAIAVGFQDPTGDDRSLIRIELAEDTSRGRLKELVEGAGLPTIGFCSWHGPASQSGGLHLVEIAEFVAHDDPRLTTLAERLGDRAIRVNAIGGYAVPPVLALPAEPRKG